jgi:hypothetical protein
MARRTIEREHPTCSYLDETYRQMALGSELSSDQRAYWQGRLEGVETAATPHSPGASEDRWGGVISRGPVIGPSIVASLEAVFRTDHYSEASVYLAAVASGIAELTGLNGALFWYFHHGRDRAEVEDVVGVFARRVPTRVTFPDGMPLLEVVGQFGADRARDRIYSDAPFSPTRLSRAIGDHVAARPAASTLGFVANIVRQDGTWQPPVLPEGSVALVRPFLARFKPAFIERSLVIIEGWLVRGRAGFVAIHDEEVLGADRMQRFWAAFARLVAAVASECDSR